MNEDTEKIVLIQRNLVLERVFEKNEELNGRIAELEDKITLLKEEYQNEADNHKVTTRHRNELEKENERLGNFAKGVAATKDSDNKRIAELEKELKRIELETAEKCYKKYENQFRTLKTEKTMLGYEVQKLKEALTQAKAKGRQEERKELIPLIEQLKRHYNIPESSDDIIHNSAIDEVLEILKKGEGVT